MKNYKTGNFEFRIISNDTYCINHNSNDIYFHKDEFPDLYRVIQNGFTDYLYERQFKLKEL